LRSNVPKGGVTSAWKRKTISAQRCPSSRQICKANRLPGNGRRKNLRHWWCRI